MTADVVWQDPPPSRGPGSAKWWERLEPLMAQPGRWALVLNTPTHLNITNLRTRKNKYPPGRWEFVSRSNQGRFDIYARYLGPEDEA